MTEFFVSVVNMSISAGWIVLAVLLLRLLLKKAPKWITVLLWGIVAVRLVCPFTIESALSLIPSAQTINPEVALNSPAIDSGVPIVDNIVNPVIGGATISFQPEKELNFFKFIMPYLAGLWLVGIAALLIYTVVSYAKLKKKIGTAVLLRDNIFQSESVISPFVLGLVKPRIYLPFNMNEQDMEHVIAHEQAHIRRKDHWWKPFGFLLLTIHWFNPLMWLGYVLLCRDIELACDEKVIKELNTEQKADYSQALLTCSVNRRMIAACPLAFGEVGVKNRVKSVLNYKKPAFWIIVVAIAASVVVAVCFLTNPKKDADIGISSQTSGSDLNGISVKIVDSELSGLSPFIKIKWTNNTEKKITYGEEFYIYQNTNGVWEDCRINDNYFWNLVGYWTLPKSTSESDYYLSGLAMTQPGEYRFETEFSVDGESNQKYKAWIEFKLEEGIATASIHNYKPIELVYDDGMYSYVQTVDVAPTFMIVNGMQLYEKYNDGNISLPLGTFEEITLSKETFDSRFRSVTEYSWQGDDTLKSLKNNNKRIWQLYCDASAETPQLYILLEQKDGTFYLGFGCYNCNSTNPTNPDDSHIRWLYKVEETSVSNVGGAVANNIDAFESTVSYANWTNSSELYTGALNGPVDPTVSITGKVYDLPIYRFDTLADLDNFKQTFGTVLTMDSGYDEVPSFNDATAKYDKSFFENNSLILVYVGANNCTHRFSLAGINHSENRFYVSVQETTNAEVVDTAMAGWFITVTASDDLLNGIHIYDAELYYGLDERPKEDDISSESNGNEHNSNSGYVTEVKSDLNTAIASVLNEKYRAEKPDGLLHIENYHLLANETASGTPLKGNSGHMEEATVYLLVYHMKYSVNGGQLEEVEGDFVPTSISFKIDENGQYTLKEYWTPRSGANYEKDVLGKFPGESATDVLNTEQYAEDLIKENWRLANEALSKIKS